MNVFSKKYIKKEPEHTVLAALSFLIPFIVYLITIAPTVSFWDCGEFIACSKILGVPHPPGAPLYILIGKLFTFLIFIKDVALRVNLFSALASAATVLIIYLTLVRLIKERKGYPDETENKIIVYSGAFIGALSFAFTDSFWFNAVEAEVYAFSMLLTTLMFWLALLWMDTHKNYKSLRFLIFIMYLIGLAADVHLLGLLVIPSVILLIYFTEKDLFARADIWIMVPILSVVAYSLYIMLFIRSGQNPPIDENNPENWKNIVYYLKREQYGQWSILQRQAPLWAYQIKKMFIRYFGWQFIGKGTTIGEDRFIVETISINGLYGLPFLVGVFGMIHHFFKDWKRALSVLVLFIMTGIAIVIYLNQPDPQPRERDYVYVGCFYAFALWIGIGVTGVLDSIKDYFKNKKLLRNSFLCGSLGILFIILPLNLFYFNFESHDRSGNYVAWDYSYNIIQTCEKNAILFTNGDNDTFPLWYLQFVEGIRQDVNIVNLSLLNSDWYMFQLKYGDPPVPISYSDEQIEGMMPQLWEKKSLSFNVPPDVHNRFLGELGETVEFTPVNESQKINFVVQPTLMGRGIRIQDLAVLNIIHANNWKRPVYFAMTVPNENKVGLTNYLRMDGLSFKLVSYSNIEISPERLEENLMGKYLYRGLNDPSVYYDIQTLDLLQNVRTAFLQLIFHYYQKNMEEKTLAVLDKLSDVLPETVIPAVNPELTMQLGQIYKDLGRPEELKSRLEFLMEQENIPSETMIQYALMYGYQLENYEKAESILKEIISREPENVRAYSELILLLEHERKYQESIDLLNKWLTINPDDSNAGKMIERLRKKMAEQDSTKQVK